ncbi:MAG: hypothetical protein EXR50_06645 [Dehalococcoidia bacterium]|nr:hypothetical protein [Dehalococcoidia bacterium]
MKAIIVGHLDQLTDLCRCLQVRRLDLFGSAVSGGFDPDTSDLDFLVEFEPMPPIPYSQAYYAPQRGLEEMFRRPVDLVSAKSIINTYFAQSVAASKETVYVAP